MRSFLPDFQRESPYGRMKRSDSAFWPPERCVPDSAPFAPNLRRPSLATLGRLAALANCLAVLSLCAYGGCGSTTPAPVVEAAHEYLQALIEPEWGNAQQASTNWKQAYELLHPEAKANKTLADFNRQQWQWMKADKRGWILKAEIQETDVSQEDATVNVLLQFGQKQGEFDSLITETLEAVLTLKKNGADWAVVSVKDK
jgi:hypothetical protein